MRSAESSRTAKSNVTGWEPAAAVIARKDAEIGVRQLSESMPKLNPIKGIAIVDLLPAAVQKGTTFSASIVNGARNEHAAQHLIRCLASSQATPFIQRAGTVPASAAK